MARPKRKRASIEALLRQGGERRIELLRFCVMSVTMEPVFIYLTNEYRMRPSNDAALALYDVFCAPGAPARINALPALPPRNLQLSAAIDSIRMQCRKLATENKALTTPSPRYLFDFVVESVTKDTRGSVARLQRRYDPSRSAIENLPGGRMTPGQSAFVERIWKPIVRPQLVISGFWRIETIE